MHLETKQETGGEPRRVPTLPVWSSENWAIFRDFRSQKSTKISTGEKMTMNKYDMLTVHHLEVTQGKTESEVRAVQVHFAGAGKGCNGYYTLTLY